MEGYNQIEEGKGTPYPQSGQGSEIYAAQSSYVSHTSEVPQRPEFVSLPGFLMLFSSLLWVLAIITGLIALITVQPFTLTGASGARVVTGLGVQSFNALFTFGWIAFLNFAIGPLGILAEFRFPLVIRPVALLGTYYGRAGLYFVWGLALLGMAGDFGIAIGTLFIFNFAFNIAVGFLNRNQ